MKKFKRVKEKFIRKIGKIPKLALAILMAASAMNFSTENVNAASYTSSYSFVDGWYEKGTVFGQASIIKINDEIAWCIEGGKLMDDGAQTVISASTIGYTKTDIEKMALIAYYGYRNRTHNTTNYMLTQNLIWRYKGSSERVYSSTYPDDASYADFYNDVMDKVNSFNDLPSFNNKTYTVDVGETLSITDTEKVLSGLKIASVTGGTATISGNTLKVTPNGKADTMTILFNRGLSAEQTETNFIVRGTDTTIIGTPQATSPLLSGSDPYRATVRVNVNLYGSLKIAKQDEDGTYVPNTSFKVSKNSDMSSPIGTYKTGSDGTVTVNELLPGTYYVQETAVPSHLVLDSTVHKVTVEANQTTTYNAKNNWIKGKIKLRKIDSESKKQVAGATYAIYNANGQELERLVTTATGYVESGYLRFGDYTVKEVISPYGYVLNKTEYPINVTSNEQTIEIVAQDMPIKGRVTIHKEDSATGKQPQGEATLKGAVYELRAKEAIVDPADGEVKYAKDALVATLTTDENADATVSNLYLGKYYLQEKTPSKGYTLDTTTYDIDLTRTDPSVSIMTKEQTVKERVIAQAFSIIKISSNESGEADILAGAEFTIKSQKDIDKYGSWEAAPIAKNANGQTAAVLVTDKNGYAVSDELPYGTYVVRETKTPDDHYTVDDFTVVITDDSRDPQPWRVFNDQEFESVIAMVKQDAATGKTVQLAGAEFKIKNLDTNEYVGYWEWNPFPHYVDSWTTDETGTVMTGDVLKPGEYQVEEITAPNGYVLNKEPVKFTVSNNTAYETLPDGTTPVITVTMQDTSVKGRITVSKEGEVLTSADKDENGNVTFNYESRKLEGAVFEVYAKENILSADNHGDVIYQKDELVETLTTDESGEATTKLLPLGDYYVKEKTAPIGYVQSNESKEVKLVYEDQNTPVVFENVGTFKNDRQKVKVIATKADETTNQMLEGAEITLYANRDVYNFDGDVILAAGEKIETITTGSDGTATFTVDLPNDLTPEYGVMPIDESSEAIIAGVKLVNDPNSLFYATETKAPEEYATGQEIRYYIDTKYTTQEEPVLEFKAEYKNEAIKLEVSKTDITGEQELPGNHLEIHDKNGNVVEKWVSTNEPYYVEGLPIGEYTLVETKPADGYTTAASIKFEIKDTAEVQKVHMVNDVTKLQVSKTDITGEQELAGNHLEIRDSNDDVIEKWVSTNEPHYIEGLPIGEYTLVETKPADGYVTAASIKFKITDTAEVQKVHMVNDVLKMTFSKVGKTGTDELEGAKLQIINKESGEIMDEWISGGKPHVVAYLVEGKTYIMKEISAPHGYELAKDIEFVAKNGKSIVMKDKRMPSTPKTGDDTDIRMLFLLTFLAGAAMVLCIKRRKHKSLKD